MSKIKYVLIFVVLLIVWLSTVEVDETEKVVIKRAGVPVRELTNAGLYLKIPFVETEVVMDKRLILADFTPQSMPTSDAKNFIADMFCLWKINDGKLYVQTVGANEKLAESRLSRVVFSEAGSRLAKNPLDETLTVERDSLMAEAAAATLSEVHQIGTEVVLIRLNNVDLPASNKESTYNRMKANLNKIKSELLSSGQAEADRIVSEAQKNAAEVRSGAHLEAETLKAQGIKEAGKIRTEAYKADLGFYTWYRSWLTKQRVWAGSKPDMIFQNGTEEYNRFDNNK
jgi:membrane protease subunit HflC